MVKSRVSNLENFSLFEEFKDDESLVTHEFGGIWTNQKLNVLKQYLQSFTIAFANSSWAKTIYIDACAGTGSCDINIGGKKYTIAGSAKLALDIKPQFNEMVLIENNKKRYDHLINLKNDFPHANLEVFMGDCNEVLPDILHRKLSNKHRGVVFVDPYGMNISWDVIKALATKKLDVWYLFPLSGLYRQAAIKREDVDEKKAESILRILGDPNWESELYANVPDLFGETDKMIRIANVGQIVSYITRRLKTVFPYVAEPVLFPSVGPKRFALYFALSNDSEKAIKLVEKISSHILKAAG